MVNLVQGINEIYLPSYYLKDEQAVYVLEFKYIGGTGLNSQYYCQIDIPVYTPLTTVVINLTSTTPNPILAELPYKKGNVLATIYKCSSFTPPATLVDQTNVYMFKLNII